MMNDETILSGSFNRCSAPSRLRITDMRFTDIAGAPMHCTLMKIYTNQGIVGLGEVRDGGSRIYAEMLKCIPHPCCSCTGFPKAFPPHPAVYRTRASGRRCLRN